MPFELQSLPYAEDKLEPYIDAQMTVLNRSKAVSNSLSERLRQRDRHSTCVCKTK